MMKKRMFTLALALAGCGLVFAQAPAKPVRIVVSFNAGGPVDFVTRTLAEPLSKELGRTVIVENKPGANGAIGANEVLRAPADGNTIWISSVGAAAINSSLYGKLSYDMARDFAPVSLVVNNVELFVVNKTDTTKDARSFVERAKAASQPTPIASSGIGSIPHLALIQLQDATGADLLHVPYSGMAPALKDLMGGQVAGVFADVPAVMARVKNGSLHALGIAAKSRHPGLPDVPTFEELGFQSVDTNNWYALFVSAKTPAAVVDGLNKAVRKALADADTVAKLTQSGAEVKTSTPAELAAIVQADTQKWAAIIKAKNIKPVK